MKTLGIIAALIASTVVWYKFSYPSVHVRARITVEVETSEGLKTGSAVNELGYISEPAIAASTGFGLSVGHGEAVAVDLGARGVLYALLAGRHPRTGEPEPGVDQAGMYMMLVAKTSLDKEGRGAGVIRAVRAANGKAEVPAKLMPFMVRFRDDKDPKTVEAVDPAFLSASFGEGVRLKRVTIETTSDPVTTGIEKRLGWLPKYYD
jgi:hypothetical protein